jgi:hypothetical protein
MSMGRVFAIAGLALVVATSAALAQQPKTVRIRATIEKVDGNTLMVKARDGANLTVKMADHRDAAGRRQQQGDRDP